MKCLVNFLLCRLLGYQFEPRRVNIGTNQIEEEISYNAVDQFDQLFLLRLYLLLIFCKQSNESRNFYSKQAFKIASTFFCHC